jgi:MFS family permease
MVRWTVFCAVGDVLAPLVTGAALALGASYRGAMLAIGLVVAAQCAASACRALRDEDTAAPRDATPPAEPLRAALALAFRRPRLWAWLFAAGTCTLLDELVVALAALRLERDQGAGEVLATAAALAFSVGSVAGAAVTDAVVARFSSRRVLVVSGLVCALALGAFLVTHSAAASCVALALVGVTCAAHHPLAQAKAYEELPDRPGTVQALGQAFVVLDVVAPLVLGVVADRYGLRAAIACLVVQPVVIVACAALFGRRTRVP